jgi:cytoskeletal protein RodZ
MTENPTPGENSQMSPVVKETLGSYLKQLRMNRNVSLEDIAQRTRILLSILKDIEENNVQSLPNKTYVRGFVHSYGKEVGAESTHAYDLLDQLYGRFGKYDSSPIHPPLERNIPYPGQKPNPQKTTNNTQKLLYLSAIVIVVIVMALQMTKMFSGQKAKEQVVNAPQSAQPASPPEVAVPPAPAAAEPAAPIAAAAPAKSAINPAPPSISKKDKDLASNENISLEGKTRSSSAALPPLLTPGLHNQSMESLKIVSAINAQNQTLTPAKTEVKGLDKIQTESKSTVEAKNSVIADKEKERAKEEADKKIAKDEKDSKTTKEVEGLEFKSISMPIYKEKILSQDERNKQIPNNIRSLYANDKQNLFIRAVKGDSWLRYKIDGQPIKTYVLTKGSQVHLQGQEIRIFMGNIHDTEIFYNLNSLDPNTASGVKSLVFPQNNSYKYKIPLFMANDKGEIFTSDEFPASDTPVLQSQPKTPKKKKEKATEEAREVDAPVSGPL